MISLEDNHLVFRFDGIHPKATFRMDFKRTLRIPDDGDSYPLPAGLGSFEIRHLDDFAAKLPQAFGRRGGVIMAMWQSEAMWLSFGHSRASLHYPFALKIAAGKINAITGEPWQEQLQSRPQDYLVVPEQPWLDGFYVEKGLVRQFVAASLGDDSTVEEQITGQAEHGGLQIVAYPMKPDAFERHLARRFSMHNLRSTLERDGARSESLDMGLTAGGRMRQEIYADPHGVDAWDQTHRSRCFVTILNARVWKWLTSADPHSLPPTIADYEEHRIPWFDFYAADQEALEGSSVLAKVKSVPGQMTNAAKAIPSSNIKSLGPDQRPVREAGSLSGQGGIDSINHE